MTFCQSDKTSVRVVICAHVCMCVGASVCVHASLFSDTDINRGPVSTHNAEQA